MTREPQFQQNEDFRALGRMWRMTKRMETVSTEGRWVTLFASGVETEDPAIQARWDDPEQYGPFTPGALCRLKGVDEGMVVQSIESVGQWTESGEYGEGIRIDLVSVLAFQQSRDEKRDRQAGIRAMPALAEYMRKEMGE